MFSFHLDEKILNMAKILSKLLSKDFTNERRVLVEEMVASNEEIDSLETIQTNCVWIISQSDPSTALKSDFLTNEIVASRNKEISMTIVPNHALHGNGNLN